MTILENFSIKKDPLYVDLEPLVLGKYKLNDMVNNAKTLKDMDKLMSYYFLVMRHLGRMNMQNRQESVYDMYWKKHNLIANTEPERNK